MKLYKLTQDTHAGYDTYDSCVVVAENEDEARLIRPCWSDWDDISSSWANNPEEVAVEEIGTTDKFDKPQVICASFNAG